MTEAAYEDGSNREHERLYSEVVAEEPGYFYIYLSNDGTEGGEAYFDDFSILTLESYIVQQTDYYPYGLIARNFVRAGEKETKELFQSKTYDELTGWYDFHARQYDAALGRWFGVDAYTHSMPGVSPFNSMANNPVMFVDPDGNAPITLAVLGLAMLKGALIGTGVSAATYGLSTLVTGQTWNWNQFGNSLAIGAVSGAVTGGVDIFSASLMKNVYGAVPGALVKGGLSAVAGGISGGLGNVIMEGSWGAFGSGFGKGALVGGVMGGFSGGRQGYLNAKNSFFERNALFGNLTQAGREEAFKSFVLKHELYQSGMINYSFDKLDNSYGVTKAISPETGEMISVAKAARQYPNGVNSEYTFNSKKLVSLRKIEANIIHEKQHILDLHTGKVNSIFQRATSTEGFRAALEIRAHRAALEAGFQRSYNLGRIKYWSNLLK